LNAPARLVVLVSGSGSNLQAILNACQDGILAARVEGVISNLPGAFALERARTAGVPALVLPYTKGQNRNEYDQLLAALSASFHPDLVVLAGWMRILTRTFLDRFPNQVVNLHPAQPGQYPGTHAIERALQDFQAGLIAETGVMVHLVPDEGVDNGPVLAWQVVPILPGDTLETLEERVHRVEHELLVKTLADMIQEKYPLNKGG
jgi:phosphoribosylglycinamide formyltransferase-1